MAGGRAQRHPRIVIPNFTPTRRGRSTLASFQDAKTSKTAAGGLRSAATPGYSLPTLRVDDSG